MPRENVAQWNFSSGEVSPYIAGRVDTKIYANGLRRCENFVVRPQGGATRRNGSRMVFSTWEDSHTSLLVPFVFSDVQAYVLQFGDGFIHFIKNGEPLLETTTTEVESFALSNNGGLYQVTVANPGELPGWGKISSFYAKSDNGTITLSAGTAGRVRVTTSVPHTLRTGVTVFMHASPDTNSTNLLPFTINRISAYAFDLVGTTYAGTGTNNAIFSSGLLPGDRFYISGATAYTTLSEQYHIVNTVPTWDVWTISNVDYVNHGAVIGEEAWTIPIEVVTPYAASELAELRFAQSADILYIMHPDHKTMKLTRLDNDGDRNDWLLSEVDFVDGPYLPVNDAAPNVDTTTPANGSRYLDVYMEVSGYSHTATACQFPTVSTNITATAAAAGLIRVTSVAHGYSSNNFIRIQGFAGAGAASTNGYWKITKIDADHYDLIGSTWVATGTGTAYLTFFDLIDDASTGLFLEYRQGDQWRLAQVTTGGVDPTNADCATVNILDNVLLYLDEATRFKNTPKKGSAPSGSNANSAWTPVYGTRRDGSAGVVKYQKLDPNNQILSNQAAALTGTLTSNFANTFGVSDVGKYIRYVNTVGTAYWAKILTVGVSGASAKHGAAVSMVAINPTGNFVITNEVRSATVKSYRNGVAFPIFTLVSDVGRHIRLSWGGRWAWGKIASVTSTSQVTVHFYSDLPRDPHDASNLAGSTNGTMDAGSTTGRTYTWRLGAWSVVTGYPSTACFHEQRLLFARTDTQPSTFWGSVTGDFENMTPTEEDGTVLDDSGIDFTLASGKVNAIKWMESGTTLVLGTNGGEWLARSSSVEQEPITPTNISVVQQSRNGSSRNAQPLRIGSGIVFVDRSEQNVMEVRYLFSEDRLEDKDLTIASEHILRRGGNVVQTAYQANPHGIGWFLLEDGTLAALTYNPDQEIIAWHRHSLSGTGAFIESICVVPSADDTADDLYLVVKRTINGSTKRYIEIIQTDFYPSGSSRLGMQFVDCARVVSGFSGTAITGLSYLTGETLVVLGNGTQITPASFAAGVLTLGQAYSEVVIGLSYTSTIKSLPPEGGSPHGVSQGSKKKLIEMRVRVADSFGMQFGWESDLISKDFTTTNDSETTLPFFSGTVPVKPRVPERVDTPWTVAYSAPYPLNILAMVLVLDSAE